MNIQIAIRHDAANGDIKTYVETELEKLGGKYEIQSAEVIIDHEGTNGYLKTAEIVLKVRGGVIHAKETTDDIRKSIDAVNKRLDSQLHKYKETHLHPTSQKRQAGQEI